MGGQQRGLTPRHRVGRFAMPGRERGAVGRQTVVPWSRRVCFQGLSVCVTCVVAVACGPESTSTLTVRSGFGALASLVFAAFVKRRINLDGPGAGQVCGRRSPLVPGI